MKYFFSIDDSSQDARALVVYLRSLKIVNEEDVSGELTDEQLSILNERRANYLSGQSETFSLDDVEHFIRHKKRISVLKS